MAKLMVLEILREQGHSKYWLYNRLGISYQNFNRMVNNETRSIRYENIEKLCYILQCTPSDLIQLESKENSDEKEADD